jgi:hypothetical protein
MKSEIRNQYWIFQPAAAREYTPALGFGWEVLDNRFGFRISHRC